MLTVQFAGPQNLSSCPEPRGAQEGAEPPPERPRIQRRRKCETSPPPYPGARPGLSRSYSPGAGFRRSQLSSQRPAGAGNSKEGAQEKPRPGGAAGSNRGQRPALARKAPGPKFPGPFRPQHISQDLPHSMPSSMPQPPSVLSLGILIALPGSAIWLIYHHSSHPQPRQPRACLVWAPPCFLYPCTFCPAK